MTLRTDASVLTAAQVAVVVVAAADGKLGGLACPGTSSPLYAHRHRRGGSPSDHLEAGAAGHGAHCAWPPRPFPMHTLLGKASRWAAPSARRPHRSAHSVTGG